MRRFFVACLSAALFAGLSPAPSLAVEPSLVIVAPGSPLFVGSVCGGPHPTIALDLTNTGTVRSKAVADPSGARIDGTPLSGHAGLPALAPGATGKLSFTFASSALPAAPSDSMMGEIPGGHHPLRGGKRVRLTLHVVLDPEQRSGVKAGSIDVPAFALAETCITPPTPVPTAAPPTAEPAPTGLFKAGSIGRIHLFTSAPTSHPRPGNPGVIGIAPGVLNLTGNAPAAPNNLRQPSGMDDCRNSGGFGAGLVCLVVYGNGGSGLALIWDAYGPKVDGFRLYRIDGGRRPISPQIGANGNGVTLGYVPGASNSFSGQCFVVTAFTGSSESADSRPFCVNGNVAGMTLNLTPDHTATNEQARTDTTGALGAVLQTLIDPAGLLGNLLHKGASGWDDGTALVGYLHRTNKGDLGDSKYNMYARGAVHFDVSTLAGHYIKSATLKLAVDFSYVGRGNTPSKSQDSCAVSIAPATQLWWDLTGTLSHVDTSAAVTPPTPGPGVSVDVTPIVRGWANGGTNNGFVLIGGSEDLGMFYESSCLTKYQSASLQVSYF